MIMPSELPMTKVDWLLPASTTEFLISTGVHSCGSRSTMSESNPVSALCNIWYGFIFVIWPLPNSDMWLIMHVMYFNMWLLFALIPTLRGVGFPAHI